MDDEFAQEVLRLAQGHTIDDYETQIKRQAQQLGIFLPVEKANDDSKPTSTSTFVSRRRRSTSVESRASQSTGLTSNFSRTSKEHEVAVPTTARPEKRRSTTAVSIRDYDSIVSHARYDKRRLSLNSSPAITPSPSTFSLPLTSSRDSSPRRHIIRSLSRLRLHRRSGSSGSVKNDDCPYCPEESALHRRPSHTLPCGHHYCTPALRRVIKTAMDQPHDVPPTCCRRPIPGALVERVMSPEEQASLMSKMTSWDNDIASAASSANVTSTDLATVQEDERRPRSSRQSLIDAKDSLTLEEARQNLERAMGFPEFSVLRQEQEAQRDRCVELNRSKKKSLSKEYETKRQKATYSHEQQAKELEEKHSSKISQVEDKHVQDEMDLRAMQENETRNTTIALRHMEAFCRGESVSGSLHHRTISEKDRGELAKTRYRADQMKRKHEGEINVLRGEQNRRMTQRMHRQEVEMRQLEHREKKELEGLQEEYEVALEEWEDENDRIRGRLRGWWEMQLEIWRKMLENETGIFFEGALPPMEWPSDEDGQHEDRRRDTLYDSPVREGAAKSREELSPLSPSSSSAPAVGKEMDIGKTCAVRSSVIGQA